jgi:aminoglycoside phosphotransferase (APT) family kinase protein
VAERQLLAAGREADVFVHGDDTVLKLWRDPGHASRARTEAAALRTLDAAGHLAPRPVDVVTVDGRPGLVLERVDGASLLDRLGSRPLDVFAVGRVMGDVHAAMHDCAAPIELPALRDVLRERITAADSLPERLRAAALGLLDTLPDGDRLCHGDLHPGNILGTLAAPVVIDWADAARGDPVADLARTAVIHRVAVPPRGSPRAVRVLTRVGRRILRDRYLAAYEARRTVDPASFDRWEIVRAAARCWEPVPEEHPALVGFVRHRLPAGS